MSNFTCGTDNGPVCPKCQGTVYVYNASDVTDDVHVKCCGCNAYDSFRHTRRIPFEALRAEHLRAGHARVMNNRVLFAADVAARKAKA